MVADVQGQTLAQFGSKIRARAEATNPRAVVLDLRLNQGGNGYLAHGFVRELIKTEDADTRLFVLTWRGTFSASQFILDDLDRLSEAVFVGEPASSKPTSYGDAYRVAMPNSRIDVRSSIYLWRQGQNLDPWTWVDVAAPLTFAAYAAGRDPALEAALTYTPGPSFDERMAQAAAAGGAEGVRRAAEAWRADPVNRYADVELKMAQGAERLFSGGRRQEGVALAELAAAWFPESVDAVNVLAHLADASGKRDMALRAGRRVLELDPNNRSVRPLMERLQASSTR
jgi:hypothetical protein